MTTPSVDAKNKSLLLSFVLSAFLSAVFLSRCCFRPGLHLFELCAVALELEVLLFVEQAFPTARVALLLLLLVEETLMLNFDLRFEDPNERLRTDFRSFVARLSVSVCVSVSLCLSLFCSPLSVFLACSSSSFFSGSDWQIG